ncbi:MAG: hypothetical protein R3E01_06800 [Pirellulaceae bacterium]|nr:hypothetical protein [Planctomycetales bacterium]
MQLPDFDETGCLPAGDYRLTFSELRKSALVLGAGDPALCPNWDATWRNYLVENTEVLVPELWQVGIANVFLDGSFVEDKDHPNDVDGYFECSFDEVRDSRNAFLPSRRD